MICSRMLRVEVVARLGVDDLEIDELEHHLLDVRQRDVAAVGGVVQAAVRILLDNADRLGHACLRGVGRAL